MRVLAASADAEMLGSLALAMEADGHVGQVTTLGEEAHDLACVYEYDVLVLDQELADCTGLSLLRRLRASRVRAPIISLTAGHDVAAAVALLGAGGDDVLDKPFHRDELAARMSALHRRCRGHAHPVLRVGALSVDTSARSASVGDTLVSLTSREYSLLEALAIRTGQVVSKESLMGHLYGGRDEPDLKIIDVFVCKLRKKLAAAGAGDYVATSWGRGFSLREPEPARDAA